MKWLEWVFWIGAAVVFYAYIGHGLLFWIVAHARKQHKR